MRCDAMRKGPLPVTQHQRRLACQPNCRTKQYRTVPYRTVLYVLYCMYCTVYKVGHLTAPGWTGGRKQQQCRLTKSLSVRTALDCTAGQRYSMHCTVLYCTVADTAVRCGSAQLARYAVPCAPVCRPAQGTLPPGRSPAPLVYGSSHTRRQGFFADEGIKLAILEPNDPSDVVRPPPPNPDPAPPCPALTLYGGV